MSLMGFCSTEMRLPLCEMEEKNLEILKAAMKKHNLI
jgi:dihydrodipicolinate synthase/N-acetylneuraminate lyase